VTLIDFLPIVSLPQLQTFKLNIKKCYHLPS